LGWRGIGDAVAALVGRALERRSNGHLHHRHADAKVCLMHRRKGTLGNGRYRLSVTSTQALLAENLRRGACGPLPGRSTVRESKAGFEPALPGRSIRHLHHQRWFEPRKDAANRNWIVAALSTARRALRALEKARSAIGVRLIASFPPAGPARSGRARFRASPGIRVSRSGLRRAVLDEPALRATKNPPEQWLGRVCKRADCRSCFQARPLPCARHASPIGAKPFDSLTLISRSCCIDPLMLFANPNIGTLVFARARDIRLEVPDVNGKDRDVGDSRRDVAAVCLQICRFRLQTGDVPSNSVRAYFSASPSDIARCSRHVSNGAINGSRGLGDGDGWRMVAGRS
jgi:hypothetical protein